MPTIRHFVRCTLSFSFIAMLGISLPACQSKEGKSTSETTTSVNGDPIAGSDADRASAELDAQKEEREERGRRPSNDRSRSGTRSVDQPRVSGKR